MCKLICEGIHFNDATHNLNAIIVFLLYENKLLRDSLVHIKQRNRMNVVYIKLPKIQLV